MKKLAALLFVGVIIGQANAQTVTVTLSDGTNTITPILNEPVPGLTAYPGRHSFDARTGGAFADQDTRNISSSYDGTVVNYAIDSGWQEVNNGGWTPQVVDGWLRVGSDGIGSQQNNVSWDEQYGGGYTSAVHSFQIRISEGDPTANDKADGFGWKYVNSDLHGTTGAMYTAGEEPNLAGSLGVGFDIWNNGDMDNNATTSVSLHYDGALLKTVDLQSEVSPAFSLETGQPIDVTVAVTIPEPGSMSIMLLGMLGMVGMVRRKLRA
ncbi:MAG: PEP-CTERM sorting domain-containing protein [Planctomycetales bacterium]|nr:PEP-CTERM sorting domain-containing protein [Planctomycetales bacterium]